jgi:O-antigen/teichoic acid export membrane protein
MDFRRQAIIQAIAAVLGSGIVLVLAATGFGVWSLAVGYLATNSIKTLLFACATRCFYVPSLNLGRSRDKIRFGLQVVLSRLLYALVGSVDIIVIGRMLDATQLGIFTVGKNFAFIPLSKTGAIVNSISISVYAKLQHDGRETHSALVEATKMLALIMFPASAILSAMAPDLQQLLLGDQWAASSIVIALLTATVPYFIIKEQIQHVLTIRGKMGIIMFGQILEGIAILIALIVGCQWSLLGACIGWCSAIIVSSVFFVHVARQWTGFSLKALLASVQFPVIGSLCAFAVVFVLRIAVPKVVPLPAEIVALGLVGLACYLTVMYILARSEVMRVIDFMQKA